MNFTFGFDEVQRKLSGIVGAFDRACEEWVKDGVLIVELATKRNLQDGRAEWPDLAESTVRGTKRGRRDHMLNVEGAMLRSVTSAVDKRGKDSKGYVGWQGVDNVIGPTHEFGSKRAGRGRKTVIPERAYMRPAVTSSETRLLEAFAKRVREAI